LATEAGQPSYSRQLRHPDETRELDIKELYGKRKPLTGTHFRKPSAYKTD
tara:strand:- start:2820 stop:2969 length:150 start_codon:yes stop_codon:yes gene_type:complete